MAICCKINKDRELVAYDGQETQTAKVGVADKKISVNVKSTPGVLKIIHGDEIISFDGSENQSFVIDDEIAKGSDLIAETNARKEADADIISTYTKKIDAETAERKAVDDEHSKGLAELNSNFNMILTEFDSSLEDERNSRKASDSTLSDKLQSTINSLSDEAKAREASDAELSKSISNMLTGDVSFSGNKSFDGSTITISGGDGNSTLSGSSISTPSISADELTSTGVLKVLTTLDMNDNKATGFVSPKEGTDAANKQYVDDVMKTCLSKNGDGVVSGVITAGGFIVKDGKYYQFLKADGSYDDINIEKGSGEASNQARQDGTSGTFSFTGKNPNATALDSTLTGDIQYGAVGAFSASFGGKSSAQGKRSMAVGTTTIAKGAYSFASGDNSVALGNDSFVCNFATVAQGVASFAQGVETQVKTTLYVKPSGSSSAGGTGGDAPVIPTTDVNGQGAAAMGVKTQSNGYGSLATGISTISNNTGTFTSGVNTFANGFASIAIGSSSEADGTGSFAGGTSSWAQNTDSFAFGTGAKTNRDGQFAVGKFNALNSDDLFIVGNGSSDVSRNSAFRVTSGGIGYLANSGSDDSCIARMADVKSLKATIDQSLYSYLDKRAGVQSVAATTTFTDGLKSNKEPTESNDVATKDYVDTYVSSNVKRLYRHRIRIVLGNVYDFSFDVIDANPTAYTATTFSQSANAIGCLPVTGYMVGNAGTKAIITKAESSAIKIDFAGLQYYDSDWTTPSSTVQWSAIASGGSFSDVVIEL